MCPIGSSHPSAGTMSVRAGTSTDSSERSLLACTMTTAQNSPTALLDSWSSSSGPTSRTLEGALIHFSLADAQARAREHLASLEFKDSEVTLSSALRALDIPNSLGLLERRDVSEVFIVLGQETIDKYLLKYVSSSSYTPLENMLDGPVAIASMTQKGARSFGNERFEQYVIFGVDVQDRPVVSVRDNWTENKPNLERHVASMGAADVDSRLEMALRYDEAHVEGNITRDRMKLVERITGTREAVTPGTIHLAPDSNPA